MTYLDKISSPEDLKNISPENYGELCGEIREFLIDNVMRTGGHLASNLGVVELTVAMHLAFNCPKDKFIFDVGHQSYVHKLITGRKEGFSSLRKFGGMSGFPKTTESEYDSFNVGHASTSISAALGLARARDLHDGDENIVALIGDGSLGGGMALEALNDAGISKTKLIIILNDNQMSIGKNVGGLSEHLSKLRIRPSYTKAKGSIKDFLNSKGKLSESIAKTLKAAKDKIKDVTIRGGVFEELGFTYLGIIDGHDIESLVEVFEHAKNIDGPVIIHTYTKKGMGYKDAEEHPDLFHGVSDNSNANAEKNITYSKAFEKTLYNIGCENKKVVAITAAMKSACGLDEFANAFPERFFDVGIAEQHAVTLAAGLAMGNITPVVCIYSTFLQRAYDQILHDVCLQNLHVVFAIDRAGVVGEDGETHQGIYDLSYLSHMPNMMILSPACLDEFEQMLRFAINEHTGPVAIRYPKAQVSKRSTSNDFVPSVAEVLSTGKDVTIVSEGRMVDCAVKAAELMEISGINSTVINLRTLKPFDKNCIEKYASKSKLLVTIEDNIKTGGIGSFISSETGYNVLNIGFNDGILVQGKQDELLKANKLDYHGVAETIISRIKEV